MFRGRGILKGLGELFKKQVSIEMSELPKVPTAVQQGLGLNQPPPIQASTQQNISLANSSATTTQNTFKRSSTANSMARLSSAIGSTPSQFAEAKSSTLLSPENLVRVRIWTSKTGGGHDTYGANSILAGGNVGHATLETNKIYASIWPENTPQSFKQKVNPDYAISPEDDVHNENDRQPDHVIIFYSLDTKAIEKAFEEIQKAKEPWTLFGNLLGNKGYSCSSMTLTLLEVGGLNKLAGNTSRGIVSPTSNLAVSPNNLVNQLLLAKLIEEQKHPEIMDFKLASDKENSHKNSFYLTAKAGKVSVSNTINELLNIKPEINNNVLINTTPKRSL